VDPVKLEEIARRRGLTLLVQFGSSVAGPLHARSDLDLGVLFGVPPRSLGELADLTHELQALSPDRGVDLALLNRADPLFLKQVTERGHLLYGSPTRFHELCCYAFRRYQDHRRYLAMERDYVDSTLGRMASP
jgi:predicted nucleotidyltransferase